MSGERMGITGLGLLLARGGWLGQAGLKARRAE